MNSQLLSQTLHAPNPLEAAARADAVRRHLHGDIATFTLVRTLDLGASLRYNPINGIDLRMTRSPVGEVFEPGVLAFALLERAHPSAGDYQLLPPPGVEGGTLVEFSKAAAEAVEQLLSRNHERAAEPNHEENVDHAGDAGDTDPSASAAPASSARPTFQLGTVDTWMDAGASILASAHTAGLKVISDGIRPAHHPAHGVEMGRRWSSFWRAAADAGLRGNATVLFGPQHDLDSVLRQLEAIAELQNTSQVFLSVVPVIYDPSGFHGSEDALLTQGHFDLRVLSACRLAETGVDHLRMLYAASDLKMAHLGLACGVDDLEGPLFSGERSPKEVADTFDLSLKEMVRWLEEAGYDPALRNGVFDLQPEESDEA